ncbi:MAG: hypothetical protein ACREKK_12915, partial [Candidatus Methylomirabilales bacterium]
LEGAISGLEPGGSRERRVHHAVLLERLGSDGKRQPDMPNASVDPLGRLRADSLLPGTYRIALKRQEFKPGKFTEVSPGAGHQALEPVGPGEVTTLGEVEVRAGETAFFEGKAR